MPDGITSLEQKIELFEDLLKQMKEATREAHEALKPLQKERREVERLLKDGPKDRVNEEISAVVVAELKKIGPEIEERSQAIYKKVGEQIDKLIDLSMGKEFATDHGREDLRPALAKKLGIYIREVIE